MTPSYIIFSVLEIETRKEVSKDEVLHAAEDIFNHAHKSAVRLIARQKADSPTTIMLQCLRREQIAARLVELNQLGYSTGPDTSKEFCLSDGQTVLLKCKGNIGMRTRLNKNVSNLCNTANVLFLFLADPLSIGHRKFMINDTSSQFKKYMPPLSVCAI